MHGTHTRLHQRERYGSIEVVHHEQPREHLVLPRKSPKRATVLFGEGVHDVGKGEETGCFHDHPSEAAGQVEGRGDGCFAHAVPFDDPLEGAELFATQRVTSAEGDMKRHVRLGMTIARI